MHFTHCVRGTCTLDMKVVKTGLEKQPTSNICFGFFLLSLKAYTQAVFHVVVSALHCTHTTHMIFFAHSHVLGEKAHLVCYTTAILTGLTAFNNAPCMPPPSRLCVAKG